MVMHAVENLAHGSMATVETLYWSSGTIDTPGRATLIRHTMLLPHNQSITLEH